jgi:threonine synthase
MHYVSTRGGAAPTAFLDAVLAGLAPDGGLFVPASWPRLDQAVLKAAATAPYHATAAAVLKLFAGDDLDQATCAALCQRAYGPQWASPAITPLVQVGPGQWILELFHGPSLAFKDVAMQLIGQLYDHALAARNRRLTVVCATSGDTGGAAVEALRHSTRTDLFVILPDGRVSDVQRRFMTGSGASSVRALVADGDFDAAQAVVKALFADRDFASEVALSPVNSINWARIVAQAVYFVVASCILSADGAPVNFTVPSGNFGDALAGHVARRIGAPVGRIGIATNVNDGLVRAMIEGRYARTSASTATLSPAMDITLASNFERLVHDLTSGSPDQRADATRRAYDSFAQTGAFDLPDGMLEAMKLGFDGQGVDDAATRAAMAHCHATTGEVICPHTAVAWAARRPPGTAEGPEVILATAHPAKFPETVREVLGIDPPLPAHCADLFQRPEAFQRVAADAAAVKQAIRAALAASGGARG